MRKALFIFAAMASLACSQEKSPAPNSSNPTESKYTAQAALLIYPEDPERALVIIDSAQVVGNLDPFSADITRATVYGRSVKDPQKDKALEICLRLLEEEETNGKTQESADQRLDVLAIITEIYRHKKDYENWIKYSVEMADINRQWKNENDALRLDAEIGNVLTHLGRQEEGMKLLDQSIEALSQGSPSVDRMDSWIVAVKRKINVLEEQGQYQEMIPLAQAICNKIEDYESRTKEYAEDSYRLPDVPEDRTRYCAFYKAQAWCFLARAYANDGQLDPARNYTRLFESTDYGKSFGGRRMISPTWEKLGEWEKMSAIYKEMEQRMRPDTINADYAAILHGKASLANAKGQYRQAADYLKRWASLNQILNRQLQESQAQYYAALYHQKNQELALQEAQASARRTKTILEAILVILVISILAAIYFAWQHRRIREKNTALVRLINEQSTPIKNMTTNTTDVSSQDETLFRDIDRVIREERIYTNPLLQRQDILDRFNLRRQKLNELLSAYAHGDSFPAYINSIRLEEAVRLLREEPYITISAIAEEVGMTSTNFRIQFKQRYGITPMEYRTSQQKTDPDAKKQSNLG